jgi:hypothetical protein
VKVRREKVSKDKRAFSPIYMFPFRIDTLGEQSLVIRWLWNLWVDEDPLRRYPVISDYGGNYAGA